MEPLAGTRVLDFSRMVAGSGTTRILAGFGAEVIRVEWPEPPAYDPAREGHWNLDKLSITLNLKKPEGIELARRLMAASDVVMENMRPRVMEELGLDYEVARTMRPDTIYCSMSGWGQDGPRRDWGSYGASSAAHTGIAFLTGLPDYPPAGLGVAYSDENPPWLAAVAILIALHYRKRTGEGMYIDMAQTQTAASYARHFYLDRSVNGRSARRPGFPPGNAREYPPSSPHNAFPCRGEDQWCAIAVSTDEEWQGLKKAMGHPEWSDDRRYDTAEGRYRCREEIDARVAEWTKRFERFHLAALLQDHGVPAGAVETNTDLAEFDRQLAHRGTFQIYHHPVNGPARYKKQAPALSSSPYEPKRSIPGIGEHNGYVLRDVLGLSDDEIRTLRDKDIIRPYQADATAEGR